MTINNGTRPINALTVGELRKSLDGVADDFAFTVSGFDAEVPELRAKVAKLEAEFDDFKTRSLARKLKMRARYGELLVEKNRLGVDAWRMRQLKRTYDATHEALQVAKAEIAKLSMRAQMAEFALATEKARR
jgi:cell division protein FtsB